MAINSGHGDMILKRLFDCQDQSPEKIILIAGTDHQRFSIHRDVLTACSKYFASLLGPKFEGHTHNEFILADTDGETVKMIVDFCYTGRILLTEDNVNHLLTIASNLELDMLELECRRFYEGNLSVTNAIDAWTVADKYDYVDLKQRAMHFAVEKFETMPPTEIQTLDHRLLQELLKHEKIGLAEENIFNRLVMWYENAEIEREPHMPELLQLIRLKHLSMQFLTDTAELFYKKFDCFEMVIAEYKRRASKSVNIEGRRTKSVFCLNLNSDGLGGSTEIKIEKYSAQTRTFEKAGKILVTVDMMFGDIIVHKNKLYALGGLIGVRRVSESMSSYDLNTREREILPGMNGPREFCTLTSFGKYIFVFGGSWEYDGKYMRETNSCERFNTDTKTWKTIASMNCRRRYAAAAVLSDRIYVAGGYVLPYKNLNTFESYDPESDEWTQLSAMNKSRSDFSLIELNGFLYAMGDEKMIDRYDPKENTWTLIGCFDASPQIMSGINLDGELLVVMSDGKFGQIKIDKCGNCSLSYLGESKAKKSIFRYLFQN